MQDLKKQVLILSLSIDLGRFPVLNVFSAFSFVFFLHLVRYDRLSPAFIALPLHDFQAFFVCF